MLLGESFREGSGARRRVALVTGASGEIGRATATALGVAGYALALQCRSNAGAAEALLATLTESGVEGAVFPCDLGDPAATGQLVSDVQARFGAIDALVHAASPAIHPAPALAVPDEEFLQHLTVHALAFARLARGVVPLMQQQQRGAVVGLLSTVIEPARPKRWWPYTSAKFALFGMLSGLATDVEGSGVRVVGLMPAAVRTALSRDAGVPQERALEAGEVAAMVVRALGEPTAFANGTVVRMEFGKSEVGRLVFTGAELKG